MASDAPPVITMGQPPSSQAGWTSRASSTGTVTPFAALLTICVAGGAAVSGYSHVSVHRTSLSPLPPPGLFCSPDSPCWRLFRTSPCARSRRGPRWRGCRPGKARPRLRFSTAFLIVRAFVTDRLASWLPDGCRSSGVTSRSSKRVISSCLCLQE